MRCRCGNEIRNVPEHLQDLVEWLCEKCMSTSPRRSMRIEQIDIDQKKDLMDKKDKERAA